MVDDRRDDLFKLFIERAPRVARIEGRATDRLTCTGEPMGCGALGYRIEAVQYQHDGLSAPYQPPTKAVGFTDRFLNTKTLPFSCKIQEIRGMHGSRLLTTPERKTKPRLQEVLWKLTVPNVPMVTTYPCGLLRVFIDDIRRRPRGSRGSVCFSDTV